METDAKLLIALISAGSAIAGAVIAQFVSIFRDILDKRHKRDVLLREKYEELASMATSSQEWFGRQLNAMSLSELKTSPIDARKAMVLSHIYFPLLRDACQVYVNACARFQTMLVDNHEFVEGVDAGTQAAHKNRVEFERVAEHLHLCRQRLEEEIIRHAHRYTKA